VCSELSFCCCARSDLRDNKTEGRRMQAAGSAMGALPNNSALALKYAIAAKLAEKAQPLPNR